MVRFEPSPNSMGKNGTRKNSTFLVPQKVHLQYICYFLAVVIHLKPALGKT